MLDINGRLTTLLSMQLRHKAKYLLPGVLFPEETTRDLDSYSPAEAAEKAPPGAYCFTVYSLPVVDFEVPKGFDVKPQPQDESARFYLGGQLFSYAEIVGMPGMDILASNMRSNNWTLLCGAVQVIGNHSKKEMQ